MKGGGTIRILPVYLPGESEMEREKTELRAGIFLKDGKPANFKYVPNDEKKSAIFVIAPDGTFHIRQRPGNKGLVHASFQRHGAVIGAGNIGITNGKLTDIDNITGHYRLNKEQTVSKLRYLQDNGVDLKEVTLHCWDENTRKSVPVNAHQFLQENLGV